MHNDTLKQYKKAIQIKYEIEKEGKYFDYLYKPSRGKLRDLCWLIFENGSNQDDLNVFRNLLSLDFDHTKKNKFKEKKDKFRPIETFFKGETDPSNLDAINMAAILVDFHPRPFKKFHEMSRNEKIKPIERIDKIKAVVERVKENKKKKRSQKKEKENSKKVNLFQSLKNMFSKKSDQKIFPGKLSPI